MCHARVINEQFSIIKLSDEHRENPIDLGLLSTRYPRIRHDNFRENRQ